MSLLPEVLSPAWVSGAALCANQTRSGGIWFVPNAEFPGAQVGGNTPGSDGRFPRAACGVRRVAAARCPQMGMAHAAPHVDARDFSSRSAASRAPTILARRPQVWTTGSGGRLRR